MKATKESTSIRKETEEPAPIHPVTKQWMVLVLVLLLLIFVLQVFMMFGLEYEPTSK